MGGDHVTDSWLGSFWKASWNKVHEPQKPMIGILSFEIASLMSKVVKLWHCVSDKEILRLREQMLNSVGIRKLVSEDDSYLMNCVLDEIVDNFVYVARAVVRLGKRCVDPTYHRLESFFNDPINSYFEWFGWEYKWKKMDRRVKKMERFISVALQMSQEEEVLAELEHTVRRMKANPESDSAKLYEFQQKVAWQLQVMRKLRESSPWNRTYDYTVRLLARSLFTILEKMSLAFGCHQKVLTEECPVSCFSRGHSLSALMQSSVHPSEYNFDGFCSSLLPDQDSKNKNDRQILHRSLSFREKYDAVKQLQYVAPLKGCLISATDSPLVESYKSTMVKSIIQTSERGNGTNMMENNGVRTLFSRVRIYSRLALFYSKCGYLVAPPHTLGHAALAVHYANIIVLIEKLASAPHSLSLDARDDLYNMLPTSVRIALRARLRLHTKSLASIVCDGSLVEKWKLTVSEVMEWLSPLAHKTISWQSERSIEKQNATSGANVLLVQTLFFADQQKTGEAIIKLLVGLNHICRISRA